MNRMVALEFGGIKQHKTKGNEMFTILKAFIKTQQKRAANSEEVGYITLEERIGVDKTTDELLDFIAELQEAKFQQEA